MNLNAAIECLRTVSFVLQKEKHAIPDFEPWYEQWRQRMGQDEIMRWLHVARNKVEKQGDLDIYSSARVSVLRGWGGPEPIVDFELPPMVPPEEIAAKLAELGAPPEVREEGVLVVERRWVARDMPKSELLDLLAHGYGVVSALVADAHGRRGYVMRTFSGESHRPGHIRTDHLGGRLPCMVTAVEARTARFHLKEGAIMRVVYYPVRADQEQLRVSGETYGHEQGALALEPGEDLIEASGKWVEAAKRVLQVDGYHLPMVRLGTPDGQVVLCTLELPDRQGIYVQMERLAQEVERIGATSVLHIGEYWAAPLTTVVASGKRAAEAPDRIEVLGITAEMADGRARHYGIPFSKDEAGKIMFESFGVINGPEARLASLEPIRRIWRRWADARPAP